MRKKSNTEKNHTSEVNYKAPWRLIAVKPLDDYKLEVTFVDGLHGVVEMKTLIMGKHAGVFAQLQDIQQFNAVFIQHGVATWPSELDLAPDAMYDEIKQNGTWVLK